MFDSVFWRAKAIAILVYVLSIFLSLFIYVQNIGCNYGGLSKVTNMWYNRNRNVNIMTILTCLCVCLSVNALDFDYFHIARSSGQGQGHRSD